MKYKYMVFIGRFQPFHNAHMRVVEDALKQSEKLIIAVGSHRAAMTVKNPFSYEERVEMITAALEEAGLQDRVIFLPIRDFMYDNNMWISSLQNSVANIVGEERSVGLIGHFKDSSSEYLNFFQQWDLVREPNFFGLDATDIRNSMFGCDDELKRDAFISARVPVAVADKLELFIDTEEFEDLKKEFEYYRSYKEQWSKAPYPPTFVTADTVVVQSGHVLLVKRKVNPGKGQYALPGGFIDQDEHIVDAAIRELKEETKIIFRKEVLKNRIVKSRIFDHPQRSMRGRTVTHAFAIRLDDSKPLPNVVGADDAAEAVWMPFNEVYRNEENFFEDHIHMVDYFIRQPEMVAQGW
jgi:bifunctional NMN adenylyltransferase/nudix hydrolase